MGEPPAVEVTITNLNDNINNEFLADMIQKCGTTDEMFIYYHPVTNKHLGMARVVFEQPHSARIALDKYNGKSVMGKILTVFLDPFGSIAKELLKEATSERKAPPPLPPMPPGHLGAAIPGAPPLPGMPPVPEHIAVGHGGVYKEPDWLDPYGLGYQGYEVPAGDDRSSSSRDYPAYPPPPPPEPKESGSRWDKDTRKHRDHHRERSYHHKSDRDRRDRGDRDRDRDRYSSKERSRRDYDWEYKSSKEGSKYSSRYSSRSDREYSATDGYSSKTSEYEYSSSYTTVASSSSAVGGAVYPGGFGVPPPAVTSAIPPAPTTSAPSWPSGVWDPNAPAPPPLPPLPPPPPSDSSGSDTKSSKRKETNNKSKATKIAEESAKNIDAIDSSSVDLDTRIAMMFKCGSGAAPPFLLDLSDEEEAQDRGEGVEGRARKESASGEQPPLPPGTPPTDGRGSQHEEEDGEINDDEEEEGVIADEDGELGDGDDTMDSSSREKRLNGHGESSSRSQPPSPFVSLARYEEAKRKRETWLQKIARAVEKARLIEEGEGASDISSSEDEVLLERGTYSPPPPDRIIREDDQMSLSSLSSTEDNKAAAVAGYHINDLGVNRNIPDLMHGFHLYPPPLPPNTTGGYVHPVTGVPYIPGLPPQFMGLASYPEQKIKEEKPYDPYSKSIETIMDHVTSELKQILKRDFNRRMIENTAFKRYEAWWDEQRERHKKGGSAIAATSAGTVALTPAVVAPVVVVGKEGAIVVPGVVEPTKVPDINLLLADPPLQSASQTPCDNFGLGSLGLGLRATLPKLPSFRRIRKEPSPVRDEEEDDEGGGSSDNNNQKKSRRRPKTPEPHLSDQEEMVQGSDSEPEVAELPKVVTDQTRVSTQEQLRIRRGPSVSSFFTTSSDDSSAVTESEESSDSSLSDMEVDGVGGEGESSVQRKVLTHKRGDKKNKPTAGIFDSDSDSASPFVPVKSKVGVKSKLAAIYSDTDSEDEAAKKVDKVEKSKSPKREVEDVPVINEGIVKEEDAVVVTPTSTTATPALEAVKEERKMSITEISKDVSDISSSPKAMPRTPGRDDIGDTTEQEEEDQRKKSRRRSAEEDLEEVSKSKKAKSPPKFDYNRIYSDSEEEREYQEKRRRNTEYMEQIEREFQEEQLRKAKEGGSAVVDGGNKRDTEAPATATTKALSPVKKPNHLQYLKMDDGGSASHSGSLDRIPETPGKSLQIIKDPFAGGFDAEQAIDNAMQKIIIDKNEVLKKSVAAAVAIKPVKGVNGFGKKEKAAKILPSSVPVLAKVESSDVDSEGVLSSGRNNKYSSDETSSVASSQASHVAIDHSYSLPPSASDAKLQSELKARQSNAFAHDHGYMSSKPEKAHAPAPMAILPVAKPLKPKKEKVEKEKDRQNKKEMKKEQQRLMKEQLELERLELERQAKAMRFVPKMKYQERDSRAEMAVMYEFLSKGIDAEDCEYMRRSYESLLQDDMNSYWLNATHWVDHCTTDRSWWAAPAAKKRRRDQQVMEDGKRHVTGSARTEGYYKVDSREKMKWKLSQMTRNNPKGNAGLGENSSAADVNKLLVAKMQGISREARSNQRRLLTAFGASTESELLKFNQLKFRKKQLRFAKSGIHDWGLFAMEPIAADEMVIEYVGQMIRPSVADLRETKYEAIGIGSSYLFRIDLETIIDATKCGNLARFINHCCNVRRMRGSAELKDVVVMLLFCFLAAELLRKGDFDRGREENCNIFEAADRHQRGDHLRLQVPAGGREDSVSVRGAGLPGNVELSGGSVCGSGILRVR